ncbi:MAG: transporter [Syntrophobacteraceae bacterium]
MKKFLLLMCVSMAVLMMVSPVFAGELWDPHLRGIDEGLAAGALPPQGFYFIDDLLFAPSWVTYGPLYNYNAQGGPTLTPPADGKANSNLKLFVVVDVPTLLWVPGCKFLGADYGAAIAEPFDYTNLRVQIQNGNAAGGTSATGLNEFLGGAQWGAFNTILVPYILSWHLPCDWHVKTALAIAVDDATTSPGNRVTGLDPATGNKFAWRWQGDGGIYAESGNGFWTFTPSLGISYLHAGWNFSAEAFCSFNTKDSSTNYQTGDFIAVDYTIAYTCGKWTFGLGASQENQIASDSFVQPTFAGGDGLYHSQPGTKAEAYEIGPLVGYNFGPCSLMFKYGFPLYTNNDVGGEGFFLRLVVPLGKLGM